MRLPKFLVDFVFESDTAKKRVNKTIVNEVNKAVGNVQKDWTIDTVKAVKDEIEKKIPTRRYVVTSTGKPIKAKEEPSHKDINTLWGVFSNSPGSIQSANRIIDATIGGGYYIGPIKGERGRKRDLKKLIKFFDRPNPDDTIESLMRAGLENYLAYGDWYMEEVPTKRSVRQANFEIAELYNLNTAKMSILVNPRLKKKGVLKKIGYKREVDISKKVIYRNYEVCQIRRPTPTAGVYGKAVLETNQAILQLLLRAIVYNTSVLRNGGRPPLQITLPEDSSEADADSVNTFYEKNYMGPHNAGKALVLFKGAKAEPLGITPQDMAYLELIMTGIKLVAGQYGVPLLLIGFPEGTNRSTSSEVRRAFYYTNVYPLRKLISQKITYEVIKKKMGIDGWKFDFRGLGLEESEATRRDLMTAWKTGLMSWNEVRIKMGLLPLDEKWANGYYLVGTKNDSLMHVEEAIGRTPNKTAPDSPNIPPTRNAGEGADETPEGGEKESETKTLIKKMGKLLNKLEKDNT